MWCAFLFPSFKIYWYFNTSKDEAQLYSGHIISVLLLAILFIFTMTEKFFESCITLGLHYSLVSIPSLLQLKSSVKLSLAVRKLKVFVNKMMYIDLVSLEDKIYMDKFCVIFINIRQIQLNLRIFMQVKFNFWQEIKAVTRGVL